MGQEIEFFKEKIFCGLDIGSRKIKASLSRVQNPDNFELLAVHEVDTRGFKSDAVTDVGEPSGAISAAVDGLVKRAK